MPTCIRKVSKFLDKPISEEDVAKMANHLHIDNFRKNTSTNLDAENLFGMRVEGEPSFIRKGTILNNQVSISAHGLSSVKGKNGSWKEEMFTPQLIERADKWIEENMAKIPGFSFPEN
jgi:Sulfotransferase domain